jgi:hypothetical protein
MLGQKLVKSSFAFVSSCQGSIAYWVYIGVGKNNLVQCFGCKKQIPKEEFRIRTPAISKYTIWSVYDFYRCILHNTSNPKRVLCDLTGDAGMTLWSIHL